MSNFEVPPSREVTKRLYGMAYRLKNAERIKTYNKVYRATHATQRREYNIQYRLAHPPTPDQIETRKLRDKKSYSKRRGKILAQKSEYWFANKELLSAKHKVYVKNNKDILYVQQRQYRQENKEKRSAQHKKWVDSNYKTNIQYRLSNSLRQRLRQALKDGYKNGSAVRDLGCSIENFKQYIENQFQEGMTWDNYGEWHLDHIKPLISFDLTQRKQLLEAVHFSNLRPLWAIDNLRRPKYEFRCAGK